MVMPKTIGLNGQIEKPDHWTKDDWEKPNAWANVGWAKSNIRANGDLQSDVPKWAIMGATLRPNHKKQQHADGV